MTNKCTGAFNISFISENNDGAITDVGEDETGDGGLSFFDAIVSDSFSVTN